MTKIKYGQIGVGHAHANKIQVYRESADYEVIGVVEDDPALRRKAEASELYKGLPWLTTEQLLNVEGLRVVGVETEVNRLLETAELAIAAGKHVHLDKPAGQSLPRFKRILDEAARKHLAVQMGYMYRFNPAVMMMRDWLKKGWLGEPFEVHTVMSKRVDAATRRELAQFKGGAMFELGCHIIDLVIGALGAPERVVAFPRHSSPIEDALYDNMLAVFEYPNATATVRSSVNEVDGFARRHFVICGSEGTFHIQPLDRPNAQIALRVERPGHATSTHEQRFPPYKRYVGDAAALAGIVRAERDPEFSYDHDLNVQRAVLEASAMK